MSKVHFSLAELVVATAIRQGKDSKFRELSDNLSGNSQTDQQLPARRYDFNARFADATERACLLPTAQIAQALQSIQLPFPKVWVEGVRPGCNLRTGCLYTRSTQGIVMLLVMENSVTDWKAIGWKLPEKPCIRNDRAIFNAPTLMGFGEKGAEWYSHNLSFESENPRPKADIQKAVSKLYDGGFSDTQRPAVEREMRQMYSAADFMARAMVLMRSMRVVDQDFYLDTPKAIEAQRRELAQQRQAAKQGRVAAMPTTRLVYDVTAVRQITEATKASEIKGLVKIVDIHVEPSRRPRWDHKKNEPMRNKNGELIYNRGYTAKRKVRADYDALRARKLTASRPAELEVVQGLPILTIGPK